MLNDANLTDDLASQVALPEQTIKWENSEERHFSSGWGTKCFFSQNRLDRLWDPASHLFSSTGVYFPRVKRLGGSVPVGARSKAWVCGSSAEIVGSNSTGGMDVCLL